MSIYRASVEGHINTDQERFVWTWHISAVTGSAAALAVDVADAVTLLWSGPPTPAASIQQLVPIATGPDTIVVDELDSAGRNVEQAVQTLALIGTDVNDSLPPNVSVAVSTRTALPTRAGRGRFYLPPFGTDTVIAGLLDPTARGQVAAAAKAALDHINAGVGTAVIFHRNLGTFTPIVAVDVGNVFDQQERRRDKIQEVRTRLTLA